MKSNAWWLVLGIAILRVFHAPAYAQEIQLTTDPAHQAYPSIWGNRIVYGDSRHVNGEIYLFDLTTWTETRITNHPADQGNPQIYQEKIVYVDNRNSNEDIYLFDLSNVSETRITTDSSDQLLPDIFGNYIVWQDWRTNNNPCICLCGITDEPFGECWDPVCTMDQSPTLYFFDLSTSVESQLSPITFWTEQARGPAVYGSQVAWENHNGSWIISSCGGPFNVIIESQFYPIISVTALPSLARTDLLNPPRQASTPDIFENLVGYQGPLIYNNFYYFPPSLYLYDLSLAQETDLGVAGFYPTIYGNYLVYIRDTNPNPPPFEPYPTYLGAQCQLFLYDLTNSTETQVTTAPIMFMPPAIYEDKVVYTANRYGNLDIFLYLIPPSSLDVTPDAAGILEGESLGFQALAIWSDGRTQQVACDSGTTWAITGDLVKRSCSGNLKKVSALDLPGPTGGFGAVNASYRGVSDPAASLVEVLNNDFAVLTPPPQGPLLSPASDQDQNFPNCGAIAQGPSSLAVLGLLLLALRGCRRLIRPS